MSFKRGILLIGLAVTFIPVSTVFAEDSADFVACKQIKPNGKFKPMKEKKDCFRDLAKETARQYNELLMQSSAQSTVFADNSDEFVVCKQIKPNGKFKPMKEKKDCFRDLAKETARQYNELLKQSSVHVAEPRERRSTGDRGEVAVDESGAALLTCPGETLLYIPEPIYAQEAISGNTQEIDVIDLCSPGIERWQLSDAICDYAELPIESSNDKFCFNSAIWEMISNLGKYDERITDSGWIKTRTEWCAQWGDTTDPNKCLGTRHQYTPLQEFLFDSNGDQTAYNAPDGLYTMCVKAVRMRGCFRVDNIGVLCDDNDEYLDASDSTLDDLKAVCDLAVDCIDEVIDANPDVFQADEHEVVIKDYVGKRMGLKEASYRVAIIAIMSGYNITNRTMQFDLMKHSQKACGL